jgi:rhodanese-related sulfurtransferase
MLVDVRDAKEVASGMIKGSVNIPMNELEKKIATLPTDKPVVFVCGTGARSGEAYDTVKLLGGKVQASFLGCRRQVQCRRQLHHGGEEVVTEFQRLYTGRLWSVLAWDQLTAFWQRIDPAAGWYLVAVGVSPAPTSGMAPAACRGRLRLYRAHRCAAAGGAPRILLRHRLRR